MWLIFGTPQGAGPWHYTDRCVFCVCGCRRRWPLNGHIQLVEEVLDRAQERRPVTAGERSVTVNRYAQNIALFIFLSGSTLLDNKTHTHVVGGVRLISQLP